MSAIDILELGPFTTAPATSYERPESVAQWELIWMLEGDSKLISDTTYLVPPHTVVVCRPGAGLFFEWDSRRVSRGGYVVFHADERHAATWPLLRSLTPDDVILSLLNHLVWLDATQWSGWRDQAREALEYALRAYGTGASGTSLLGDRDLPEPIERSMAFVRQRWQPGIPFRTPSLEELAGAAAVTREHLCRVYMKELGYGPISALRLLRLKYTASLLARTNLTVGQVAHDGGFGSQFHFSRCFKQAFGLSPTQFRKQSSPHVAVPDPIRRLELYL